MTLLEEEVLVKLRSPTLVVPNDELTLYPIRPRRSTPSSKPSSRGGDGPQTWRGRGAGRLTNGGDGRGRRQGAGEAGGDTVGKKLEGVEHAAGKRHGSLSPTVPAEVGK